MNILRIITLSSTHTVTIATAEMADKKSEDQKAEEAMQDFKVSVFSLSVVAWLMVKPDSDYWIIR